MHKWKTTENVKRTVIVKSAFWSVLNNDCCIKLMCTYLLFFHMSCISGLTAPQILAGKPNGLGNQSILWTIFWWVIKWLFERCQNLVHVSALPRNWTSQSAIMLWAIILLMTQNLPQLCFTCYWRHPDSLWPQLAVMLHWGDINGHTTHHGAEQPGGWASGNCIDLIPVEAITHFLIP